MVYFVLTQLFFISQPFTADIQKYCAWRFLYFTFN